jgi:NAD(P)-dependent dehydrogenase (short-subunit alcohol dehydrogenase family)
MRLAGKVALVTGAASGMGAAVATRFGSEGAAVALIDRDLEPATAVAGGIERGMALCADIGSSAEVDLAFEKTVETFGQIDLVVHAAGIDDREIKADLAAAGGAADITMRMSDEQWHEQIRVNLDGTFYVVRAALRAMVPRQQGSIVTISSIGGITGSFMVNYGAAKGGVLAFTRSVAQEVWRHGIRVNSIAPGYIDTPMLRRNPLAKSPPALAGRFGRPEEVASAALFLASDESSYITGATLIVAGPVLTI